jgi:hypothetical protein
MEVPGCCLSSDTCFELHGGKLETSIRVHLLNMCIVILASLPSAHMLTNTNQHFLGKAHLDCFLNKPAGSVTRLGLWLSKPRR